jgi:predicted peptidase
MMKPTRTLWGSIGAAVALGMHFSAAAGATWERNLTYTGTDGNVFNYWKLEQKPTDGSKVPLVIFLHGAGERRKSDGSNDGIQVQIGYIAPLQKWLNSNETKGFLLVAGQVPYMYGGSSPEACANMTDKNEKWVYLDWTKNGHTMPEQPSTTMSLHLEFLDKLLRENTDIDTSRVYVTGMSMGGFGTWDIICRRPDVFAAALPICGGGDVKQASKIASLPIWTFHGNADRAVPVANSQDMVAALRAAGSAVKYTEYDGKGHSIWNDVYADSAVLEWFFSQKKSGYDPGDTPGDDPGISHHRTMNGKGVKDKTGE